MLRTLNWSHKKGPLPPAKKKKRKSHNELSRFMSLCCIAFLSSLMHLAVHVASRLQLGTSSCAGGQRAGKAKWESGENRIFHSIKKKSPGIQNTRIQSDIKADVHLMNMEAGTKWQVAAKESHPFAFLLIQP